MIEDIYLLAIFFSPRIYRLHDAVLYAFLSACVNDVLIGGHLKSDPTPDSPSTGRDLTAADWPPDG